MCSSDLIAKSSVEYTGLFLFTKNDLRGTIYQGRFTRDGLRGTVYEGSFTNYNSGSAVAITRSFRKGSIIRKHSAFLQTLGILGHLQRINELLYLSTHKSSEVVTGQADAVID